MARKRPRKTASEKSGEASPPTVYIIAGPNGSGKTTFATEFLPEFMNYDPGNGLSSKAEAAFQHAAAKVIQRAKQTGTPVVVWREGRVQEIPSDQVEAIQGSLDVRAVTDGTPVPRRHHEGHEEGHK